MQQITVLGNEPKQKFRVKLETGEMVDFEFWFSSITSAWFFSFSCENKKANNMQLTNCYNVLREHKDTIPFGLACKVSDGLEPMFKDDFINGRVSVYILNKEEIEQIESEVYV